MARVQTLHTSVCDAIDGTLTVDGKKQAFPLSAFHAARKAGVWQTLNGIIHFAFPEDVSGYVVEMGNVANFNRPQLQARDVETADTIVIDIRFKKHDFRYATAALFALMCDGQGNILVKHRMGCESGYARERFPVAPQVKKICFALRLTKSGFFSPPAITLMRERIKRAVRVSSTQETAVNNLMRARKYRAAIAMIEPKSDRERIQLLKCHTGLHQFADAVVTYESLSPRGQTGASARIHYLRALANLGETEKARHMIETSALGLQTTPADIDFLISAYPFAAFLSQQLAQLVRGRILASTQHLKKSHFSQILRCAHDLVSEQRFEELYRLSDAIHGLGLGREEQARMHILSAQAFYVLNRPQQKLAALNKGLESFGLKPLALKDPALPLTHCNITCPAAVPHAVRGPLVTVIMTTYNSGRTIDYSLRSLMHQTYSDLEILVMDDLSSDDTREKVLRLAADDPRITLVPLQKNSGTYVAKNHALGIAKGAYITCHDSDDWAHPQKIERTIAALTRDPKLVAVASQHVRYDPARGFRGRNGYIQQDAPSLMYRKKDVLKRIGFYDSVRAGADTEHQYRIERSFGRDAVKVLPDLLTLFLWSETSLTGGGVFAIDDDAGIFSKPRSAYRKSYMHWHEAVDTHYIGFPLSERPFAIPEEMAP